MNASIRWFVNNPVAANLLMLLIVIGGFFGAYGIGKEVFPSTSVNYITVNMPYPGAGPKEVEEQIVVRIEEAIIIWRVLKVCPLKPVKDVAL